jgi:phenylacetate-CoA ligase
MFEMDKKSTLYIVSFGMGPWIAGTFMMSVTEMIARKGYPISVVTTGLEKELTINLIKELKDNFDQILIIGYPPFVKDIIDFGHSVDLDWSKLNLKLMFAAEGFSEQWRDHILRKIGEKNPLNTSTNIYGTADAGIMGMETPVSILLRRALLKRGLIKEFFGETRQPTVVQYDPTQKFFETVGKELICTSNSGIPLIRYNLKDNGDILSFEQVKGAIESTGTTINKELNKYDSSDMNWQLPFVYVFGRSDFMVNFYGLNVFPEHIKAGLEDNIISNFVSGKFNMKTETDKRHNQKLLINIELQRGVELSKDLSKAILKSIVKNLIELNSEYNKLYKELGGAKASPTIKVFSYGHENFRIGAKLKWVNKPT